MTDLQLLLEAVLENPSEDTPRLIYADELEAGGGEANVARAEFIRLQIKLRTYAERDYHARTYWRGQLGKPPDWILRWDEEERRASCLLTGWGDWWREQCFALSGREWDDGVERWSVKLEWGRGFIRQVELKLGDFTPNFVSCFSRHPVEWVSLPDADIALNVAPPDGEGGGWQVYVYRSPYWAAHDYMGMHSWGTRSEMVEALPDFAWRWQRAGLFTGGEG